MVSWIPRDPGLLLKLLADVKGKHRTKDPGRW